MTDLPRPVIEPLPPPPGQFDRVVARAQQRRQQRAVRAVGIAAVFLAGLGGGMSLDGRVAAVPKALVDLATNPQDPDPEAPAPPETSSAAAVTPQARRSAKPAPETTTASLAATPGRGPLMLAGRALSPAGKPVAGLFVYVGAPRADGFVPAGTASGITAADGTFSLPCPGTPVLLSPWPLNRSAGDLAATAEWAATFVGGATDPGSAVDAPCSRREKVVDVVLQPGSAIAGTAQVPASCDTGQRILVRLYNGRAVTVRVTGLRDGEAFRIGGLPPGQHTVEAGGTSVTVTVGGGTTSDRDVAVSCDAGPDPTDSPTPAPTPTDTSTPAPTPTDPMPTASGTPTSLVAD